MRFRELHPLLQLVLVVGIGLLGTVILLAVPFKGAVESTFAQSPLPPVPWYSACPHSPFCSPIEYPPQEPYPTATARVPQEPWAIQPTYTVVPTPPCRETATCEPDVPPTPLPTLTAVPTNTLIPSPTPYPTATDYPPQPADW